MSPARGTEAAAHSRERRFTRRYPVGLDLSYKLSRGHMILKEGSGRTRDLSEGGVFFFTYQPAGNLPAGLDVELSLDWPTRVNGKVLVTVSIFGHTVRSGADGIGVRISRCDICPSPSSRRPSA